MPSFPKTLSKVIAETVDPSSSLNERIERRSNRVGRLTGFSIAATGAYLPEHIVRNEDLDELGCDSDWIVQRSGIHERRRASPDQACSDLAYEAAIQCLQRASVKASELDMIIVATITPDHLAPSTSCIVQGRLGCTASAMDVNAACSGFMYALTTAAHFIRGGCAKKILVIGSDIMTRTVNPHDPKTYPLFGDGAGAVLVVADNAEGPEAKGFLGYTLGADGSGQDLIKIPAGGSREPFSEECLSNERNFFRMDGRSVFKWAVRMIVESSHEVLLHAGLTPQDLDLLVLHQANARIIQAAAADFEIPIERLFVNVDRLGNTSSATMPLVLNEAFVAGRIHSRDLLLLCGFGAGLTWGTAVMRW